MRRVTLITFAVVTLLLSGFPSRHVLFNAPLSASSSPKTYMSYEAVSTIRNSCIVSPPVSSPPSVAYVTNISSLAHWQRKLTTQVNVTRLLGLLTSLSDFNSRHPFVSGSNASINLLLDSLLNLGLAYDSDWFFIPKETWNGSEFIAYNYWTRNLYVAPWGINSSAPSLIITCHTDSARYTLLGLSVSDAPGANDNAAGVAVLMETLHILSSNHCSFKNWNILFAFLGGEEGNGTLSLWGSQKLVSSGLG
ncbi:MAG: M28 family peptidase, partial [Candidatus Thorarchaeota archaeon]